VIVLSKELKLKTDKMSYKTIKIDLVLVAILLVIPLLNSCESSDETDIIGNWVEESDFDGVPRSDAVGFSIGSKGYVGTGYDGETRLNDFWEYDPLKNSWTQKADFPGVARNSAIGFSINTMGYVGTGYDGKNKLKDFWEYDPSTNKWSQKSDFGGTSRYAAVAMSIDNFGYVGTGFDGTYLKDFWQYNPETNLWSQKTSIGGSKRRDAACFVIDGKGYITTGIDNGNYEADLWEYNPVDDTWTKKRAISNSSDDDYDDDYSEIIGIYKVGLSINGKGYLVTGGQTTGTVVWEYNPVTDLWIAKTSFEGTARADAVGFTIGNLGYLTTGKSGSYYFDDLWSFHPDDEYDDSN
jgi:N-acetylneuraminic acid mutarotase